MRGRSPLTVNCQRASGSPMPSSEEGRCQKVNCQGVSGQLKVNGVELRRLRKLEEEMPMQVQ